MNAPTLMTSLCWNCNAVQDFYAPRCERCGATNPNVDMQRANAEALDELPIESPCEVQS
jgi:ribosomal protein L40E